MRSSVVRYGLKAIDTEYEYLNNEYLNMDLASMQGSTQPLDRFLFPKKLIQGGRTKKLSNFNLADVTGDQRLLELFPSNFTNFQVNKKDFSKTFGFEDTSYKISENKISDIYS